MAQSIPRILLVDDSPDTLEVLERNLSSKGFEVATTRGVREAITLLEARPVDLVITDLKMPEISGLDLVRHVSANCQDTAVLMITGYPSVGGAVQAVKAGAEDFLPKPFTDEELMSAVTGALRKLEIRRTLERGTLVRASGLVGGSEPMRRLLRQVGQAAHLPAAVVISGEAGTGKQLVARAIHYSGPAAARPFVLANVAAIPVEHAGPELESLVQAARGGTWCLEEVHLSPRIFETALARISELAPAQRPRLIVSLRRSLSPDLASRLAALAIAVPPLRERGDDVLELAHHFETRCRAATGRPPRGFTDGALAALRGYPWPGNVRELQSLVERLAASGESEAVDVPDLPAPMRFSAVREPAGLRTLEEVESGYIDQVLAAVQGNRTRAAEILGIDRKTLREKMKRNVRVEDPTEPES